MHGSSDFASFMIFLKNISLKKVKIYKHHVLLVPPLQDCVQINSDFAKITFT